MQDDSAAKEQTAPAAGQGLWETWPLGKGLRVRARRFVLESLRPEQVTDEIHGWFFQPEFRRSFPTFNVPESREKFAKLYGNWKAKTMRTVLIRTETETVGFLWVAPNRTGELVQTHNFVGNKAWRGLGVVHEARGFLMHALFRMGVSRIWGMPRVDNVRAIRCYEEQGFVREGQLRLHYPHPDGGRADAVAFGMLPGEFDLQRATALPERARQKIEAARAGG